MRDGNDGRMSNDPKSALHDRFNINFERKCQKAGRLANAMIAPSQIRAARGLLDISQAELAIRSGVGLATIRRIENARELRVTVQVLLRIQQALEKGGIIFIDQDEQSGPGVRLRRPIST
jgi:DNA-binding transcriptional regulator YiaG